MRAVNLLPRDAERTRSGGTRAPLLVAAGGLAAVTAVAVMLSLSASGVATEHRATLAWLDEAISLESSTAPSAVPQAALAQERSDRVSALAAALSTRLPFDRLLRELSLVLPEDAWLTGITAAAPATTAAAGAAPAATATQGVTIQGATYSHQSVARVLARLGAIPSLESVRLTASARVEPQPDKVTAETSKSKTTSKKKGKKKQKTVVTFSVAATLRTGSAS